MSKLDGMLLPIYHDGYQPISVKDLMFIISKDKEGSVCRDRHQQPLGIEFECNDDSEFCNNCALNYQHRERTLKAVKKLSIERLRTYDI